MKNFFPLLLLLVISCDKPEKPKKVEEYPVLETMGYFQRFSHKLWLAGKNENWELAEFYAHELEEVTEELIKGDVIHDNYNLSNLAEANFAKTIERIDEAIDQRDPVIFREFYDLMISNCNLCHSMTRHSFIKIITPNDSTIFNQEF